MKHADHVRLLRAGIPSPEGAPAAGATWADFGAGEGAFTLALADLLGPGGEIYAVDRAGAALRQQAERMRVRFPRTRLQTLSADFTRPLDLPPLDGVVMANALHFAREKTSVLRLLYGYLKPGGRFILVEYNADRGNPWVPHPLSYPSWEALARQCGFRGTRLLETVPSRFLGEIYSALSLRPAGPGK